VDGPLQKKIVNIIIIRYLAFIDNLVNIKELFSRIILDKEKISENLRYTIDNTFAHLGCDERNLKLVNKLQEPDIQEWLEM
jgi:hypothetical protein